MRANQVFHYALEVCQVIKEDIYSNDLAML